MRRLYIKLVLWLNGYCPKHGLRKKYYLDGGWCARCAREAAMREYAEKNARKTYLDKLLEEFNR